MDIMEKTHDIIVEQIDSHKRLDVFLSQHLGVSRSQVEKLIENGFVKLNSQTSKPSYRIKGDDRIFVTVPEAKEISARPQDIPLNIVYEDKDIIVINKPRGIVVHPAAGHSDNTLVNALLFHCKDLSGIGGNIRPGVVHRLDKDTSGLLVFAKNDDSHEELSRQIKNRQVKKTYLALVYGIPKKDERTIDDPLGRSPKDRKKIAVIKSDNLKKRDAITDYRVIEKLGDYSLLELDLKTGRTHQIRVHLAHLGNPIVGDHTYSRKRTELWENGQLLHSYKLSFNHPKTGKLLEFKAEMPEEMKKVIGSIKDKSGHNPE
jgi:23S rRNA pseudouridine1911/1915/1917 synthase